MPSSNLTLYDPFLEAVFEKKHNFSSDTFTVALTTAAPTASHSQLTDLTEISYTNCSSRVLTGVTCTESGGTVTVDWADLTLTASGGDVGPFRYVHVYNETATNDDLVGSYDYGSSVTVQDGETFLIQPGANVFTVSS